MLYLEGTIDRFENDVAVIRLETGSSLLWPKEKLPSDCHEGSVVKVGVDSNLTKTTETEILAKDVLNEILKNE
ncbi:MAG: hypothetical protein UT02_C0021G0010 [Parcubacteria group bacterium GW2011_GWC2_38_7]|nr:MAG: hypothetical protein UT02_C0021G0010 [Parcubacteria group bacterium GW2011_GWC2_38_7]